MHELSIAISLVEQVTSESEERGGLRITAVHLLLGRLSGVDKEALAFCYGAVCEGTPLAGSQLVVELVPVLLCCPCCGAESEPVSIQQLACPHCSGAATVVSGFELEVCALEVAA